MMSTAVPKNSSGQGTVRCPECRHSAAIDFSVPDFRCHWSMSHHDVDISRISTLLAPFKLMGCTTCNTISDLVVGERCATCSPHNSSSRGLATKEKRKAAEDGASPSARVAKRARLDRSAFEASSPSASAEVASEEVSIPASGGTESVEGARPACAAGSVSAVSISAGLNENEQDAELLRRVLPEGYSRMPRLWRTIPVGSRAFFLPLARRECVAFKAAYIVKEADKMIESMTNFLTLIRNTMTRPRGGRQNSGRGVIAALNRRLTAAAAGNASVVGMAQQPPARVLSISSVQSVLAETADDTESLATAGLSDSEAAIEIESKTGNKSEMNQSNNSNDSKQSNSSNSSEAKRPLSREAAFAAIGQDGIRRANAPAEADARAVRRAETIISSGVRHNIQRATKALVSHSFGDVVLDDKTKAQVAMLHPKPIADSADIKMPQESEMPRITVDSDALRALFMRVVANGSCSGPSGWTGEQMATVARDAECLPGLTLMVQAIINEELPECNELRALLLASRLVLSGKKDGSGVRPIAMGETLFKAACMYVRCIVMKEEFAGAFNDGIQFGVAVRGGCDTAIHKIQSALDSDRRHVAVLADIQNAYNTRERADIALALFDDKAMRPLCRLFRFAYLDGASPLLVYGVSGGLKFVQASTNGVRQGDPLSSALFALSMREIYHKVSEVKAEDGSGVTCVAVQDDFTIIGRPVAAAKAMDLYLELCERANITVNRKKCKVCVPAGTYNPERRHIDSWAKHNSIPVSADRYVQLLGSVVGEDERAMAEWAEAHVSKHDTFFRLLPRMHKQSAMLLLRTAGVPKISNMLRTLPPRISHKAATEFDARVARCFGAIAGIESGEMTPAVISQMRLPLRLGGSGMTSAAAVAPAAYVGAAAMAAPYLNKEVIMSRAQPAALHPLAAALRYPPPPLPPPPPPVPTSSSALDSKHSIASVAGSSSSSASAPAPAAPTANRVSADRPLSSLHRLPAPTINRAAKTIVESVNECYDSIMTEYRSEHFKQVKGFTRGPAFWRAHCVGSSVVGCSAGAVSSDDSSSESGAVASSRAGALSARKSFNLQSGASAKSTEASKKEQITEALQFRIMKVVNELNSKEAFNYCKASPKDNIRLAACSRSGAYGWLTIHPLEDALRLSNGEYVSATRHMYGLSPIASGWYCRCGERVKAGHFHTCRAIHGPATNTRHETVTAELALFGLSHLQLHVEKAPSIATADGSLIEGAAHIVPDVVFRGANFQLAIDVSFVCSESDGRSVNLPPQSHGKAAYNIVRRAMADRAQQKIRKYSAACAKDGLEFDAFVADSHGALDASANRVIDRLVKYGAEQLDMKEREIRSYCTRRVAIAIQRGNARLDQCAVAKSRNGFGAAVAMGYAGSGREGTSASDQ